MTARSKLKNFAPKILLRVQLALLAIRNANIVTDSMPIITPYKLYQWLLSHFLTKKNGLGGGSLHGITKICKFATFKHQTVEY